MAFSGLGYLFVLIFALFWAAVYLLPTLIAYHRRVNNGNWIFILNLFFGWTAIGWLVALILALASQSDPEPTLSDELQRLASLRDAGVLTEEEFAQSKRSLLYR